MGLVGEMGVRAIAKRLPKAVSPKTHAIIDYALAGAFLTTAAVLWKRNRRAAVASLVCGAAQTANSLLTDYPGGVANVISFSTHRRIEMGLATALTAIPRIANIDGNTSILFRTGSLALFTVTELTPFEAAKENSYRSVA